jgi:hypothetical protein
MFAASKSGRASGGPTPTDPSFAYVPLLLNTTSTNGQNNQGTTTTNGFLDSSTNNFTITRNGTPTQGSITPYWPNGQWSNYFNGSTDYLSAASNAAFGLGTGDFTIECWIYLLAVPTAGQFPNIFFVGNFGALPTGLFLNFRSSGTIALVDDVNVYASSASPLTANTWFHVAAVRSSGSSRIYVNGVGGTAVAYTGNVAQNNLYIGYAGASNQGYPNAYISNWRLVKGVAVYTGNFTPPTAPLAATQSGNGGTIQAITGTQTSLLTCQSNRFRDNSAQVTPATITPNGTPRVQAFQPFSPTASYTTALYGGSGYFNGSTDSLSRLFTSTTDGMYPQGTTYTFEAWVYLLSNSTDNVIYEVTEANISSFASWELSVNNSTRILSLYVRPSTGAPTVIITGNVLPLNTWSHIAVSVSSGSGRLFINGTQAGSTTTIPALTFTPVGAAIGIYPNGYVPTVNPRVNGFISNLRLVQSTAVYTGAFTPPTAPVTAITNTSLLLNFTNAGIYDAAVQNDLTTVADAQVSTTQSKWSPTSVRFDGSGDALNIVSNPALNFGSGSFTLEAWVYLITMSGDYFTIGSSGAGGAFFGFRTADIGYGRPNVGWDYQAASGMVINNWYHIAYSRSGTSMRMFVNGTQVGATQTTSQAYDLSLTSTTVGALQNANFLNGYIQDLRITRGIGRYTANFSVPTAAFPTR